MILLSFYILLFDFFNNTIGNLLHVVTANGADEMQIIRILLAQAISMTIVIIIYNKRKNKLNKEYAIK